MHKAKIELTYMLCSVDHTPKGRNDLTRKHAPNISGRKKKTISVYLLQANNSSPYNGLVVAEDALGMAGGAAGSNPVKVKSCSS